MLLFLLTAAGLVGIGLYGLLANSHLAHKVLAANVMVNGVFLAFIALARRNPLLTDPLPHALVLTGIIIAVSTTAFALAILKRLPQENVPSTGSSPMREEPSESVDS